MQRALKILAIDDELLALRRLEIALGHMPDVTLVGTARSGRQALPLIASAQPDVLLVDIKMAGMDGFELVAALEREHMPLVIFVTAFDAFATRAFDINAIDYVLKPVEFDRLHQALEKAREKLEATDMRQRAQELQSLVGVLRDQAHRVPQPPRYEAEMWVQRRGEFVRLRVGDIEWVEADRDYVHLHAAGRSYMMRETMGNLESRLDPEHFMRIRRSALVRKACVSAVRLQGYGHFRIILNSGEDIRIGRTYIKAVRDLLRSGGTRMAG
jgi:DNA-binding LytR/AlgR family response regulator